MSQEPAKITNVLLVDDDVAFVKIVQHHLQKYQDHEFKLVWKDNVEDAIEETKTNTGLDIIITDYQFAGATGLDFCLQLNQLNNQTPIIFITSMRDVKLAIEAMKLGVDDFLVKDDLAESLLPRTILNVLDRVQRHEQLQAVEKRILIAEKQAEAIRQLVVTVCHEFNNPLAAIKISSDLVQRQQLSAEDKSEMKKFEEFFIQIDTEIKRLRDINFEKYEFRKLSTSDDKAES
ncbi:MAG: response regulator [Ignavibacteriae bacterium]|nr:response regulator [Ignavibacteriota bacterium]